MTDEHEDEALLDFLEQARSLGFLGPGALAPHLNQARAYLPHLPDGKGLVVDLGTGGGLPGVPLAFWRRDLDFLLVDSMIRRTAFVRQAVENLGLRAEVATRRAEVIGRDPQWRGAADVVVARSLAAPGVTAEYVAPLLRTGGMALVAEPPSGDSRRWPPDGLSQLGLRAEGQATSAYATLQVLRAVEPCPPEFPRKVGLPAKRPVF